MAKTISEQIADFTATLETKKDEMKGIMDAAAEAGETLDEASAEQYDTLGTEIEQIEAHIKRLEPLKEEAVNTATPVKDVKTVDTGGEVRKGVAVSVKGPDLPKGTAFTRYAIALAKSRGNVVQASESAKNWDDTPEVANILKAAVDAGTTTDPAWAAPLVEYENMVSEFIELLRPATILGRMTGLRNVPFNIKIPGQASGSSVNWVGEGAPKPVSALAFNTTSLGHYKAAGIVVMTEELVRFSNPSSEALVRNDLIATMAQFLDTDLLEPTKAEVAGVSPASLTNGVTGIAASGTTADAVRTDMKALFSAYLTANLSISNAVLVMSTTQALSISMMFNPLGQREFPGIGMDGGNLLGIPVITSENTPAGQITMVEQSEVMLADDGQVMLDVSSEASLIMDDDPATALAPVPVSLWQNNLVGVRAERFINWKKRRAEAVQMITGAAYA